jgi:hypothetical protein
VSYQNNANTGRAKCSASHAESINYQGRSDQKYFTIDKTTLQITWNNPQAIGYGAALSCTQLNAEANVLGTFAYDPLLVARFPCLAPEAEGNHHANRHGELQQRQCAGPDRCQPLFIYQLRPADRHGRRLQQGEARKHDPGGVQPRRLQGPLQTTQKSPCRGEA